MKIALMASGNLGIIVFRHLLPSRTLLTVFTDKKSVDIIQLAKDESVPCFVGNPREGRAKTFISDKYVDIALSINYLFIIERDLINWPKKYAINLHGSLLPRYRGRTPHVWAIINNEKETGISVHFITEGCDEGAIIHQVTIPIEGEDTGATILKKYETLYPEIVDTVLHKLSTDTFKALEQDISEVTFFGARTPDDGEINWDWDIKRIKNWVRAQAYPYPGAFTWFGSEKVVIDKVDFDDYNFHQDYKNGQILTVDPLRVKTHNGVLILKELRNTPVFLQEKMQLGSNEN